MVVLAKRSLQHINGIAKMGHVKFLYQDSVVRSIVYVVERVGVPNTRPEDRRLVGPSPLRVYLLR
jgi:hypothetical protein